MTGHGDRAKSAHMIGATFHDLLVLARSDAKGRAAYLCRCCCGSEVEVCGTRLRSGKTKSCGCRRARNMKRVATKHGFSGHPLFTRWLNMHARCSDPANNRFARYGGRGVRVCERWHDFSLYLADVWPSYKPGLTLDRPDNDGDYGPANFRWASHRVQARNRDSCIVPEDDIEAMRELYVQTGLSQREVGQRFGFGRDTVKHYLRGLRA